jgi:branched-chain amino acid transport system ATP-binding protein
MAALATEDLHSYYDSSHVLQGIDLAVEAGQVLSLLGRNGAGKTTLLKSIMGIVPPRRGRVLVGGADVTGAPPHVIARAGLGYVPETRGIFPSLSVEENLTLAARPGGAWTVARVWQAFPALAERRHAGGSQLSGGEQQMLSIARALVTAPRVLLLDEPTEGLAPVIVAAIEDMILQLKREGHTILLVEQNLGVATRLADQILIIGKGRIRWRGDPVGLAAAEDVLHTWLGVSGLGVSGLGASGTGGDRGSG